MKLSTQESLKRSTLNDNIMDSIHSKIAVAFCLRANLKACFAVMIILFGLLPNPCFAQDLPDNGPDINKLLQGKAYIYKLHPEEMAGKGYILMYMVSAPLSAYWNFKTDFKNDSLLTNKLITEHRVVENKDNVAITETIYATKPGVKFRWRTISSPEIHRLDFELLNAKECGQRFHYGHIQLEKVAEYTKVTQIAYFDFFGATFWMNYPWYGGMQYHLNYMAQWEQETIPRLLHKYR